MEKGNLFIHKESSFKRRQIFCFRWDSSLFLEKIDDPIVIREFNDKTQGTAKES